jgi:hypothetical protein
VTIEEDELQLVTKNGRLALYDAKFHEQRQVSGLEKETVETNDFK